MTGQERLERATTVCNGQARCAFPERLDVEERSRAFRVAWFKALKLWRFYSLPGFCPIFFCGTSDFVLWRHGPAQPSSHFSPPSPSVSGPACTTSPCTLEQCRAVCRVPGMRAPLRPQQRRLILGTGARGAGPNRGTSRGTGLGARGLVRARGGPETCCSRSPLPGASSNWPLHRLCFFLVPTSWS